MNAEHNPAIVFSTIAPLSLAQENQVSMDEQTEDKQALSNYCYKAGIEVRYCESIVLRRRTQLKCKRCGLRASSHTSLDARNPGADQMKLDLCCHKRMMSIARVS